MPRSADQQHLTPKAWAGWVLCLFPHRNWRYLHEYLGLHSLNTVAAGEAGPGALGSDLPPVQSFPKPGIAPVPPDPGISSWGRRVPLGCYIPLPLFPYPTLRILPPCTSVTGPWEPRELHPQVTWECATFSFAVPSCWLRYQAEQNEPA